LLPGIFLVLVVGFGGYWIYRHWAELTLAWQTVRFWPVAGALARRPSRQAGASTANGIAIGAAEGTPVSAIHDGVVAFADTFGGFGNLVIVDHGSQSFSLYGDLLEVSVKKGARIERGQAIGTVGPAPAGPSELYFELRIDGQSVDPLQWLKKR